MMLDYPNFIKTEIWKIVIDYTPPPLKIKRQDIATVSFELDPEKTYWARIICINPRSNPAFTEPPTYEYICSKEQPFPFVIGPESTKNMLGQTHRSVFQSVGFLSDRLDKKTASGLEFHLAIFTSEKCLSVSGVPPLNASWSGLLSMINAVQPHGPACVKKLLPVWSDVQSVPCASGGSVDVVDAEELRVVGSLQGFAEAKEKCTPEMGRKFLRHTMKCTTLFKGDGYSYSESGERGVKEYIMPRVRTADLEPTMIALFWDT